MLLLLLLFIYSAVVVLLFAGSLPCMAQIPCSVYNAVFTVLSSCGWLLILLESEFVANKVLVYISRT